MSSDTAAPIDHVDLVTRVLAAHPELLHELTHGAAVAVEMIAKEATLFMAQGMVPDQVLLLLARLKALRSELHKRNTKQYMTEG